MNPSIQMDMAGRLFEAVSKGDHKVVSTIMSGMGSVDVKDDRGWTVLMMAARHGHANVVKVLMELGCNTEIINSSGQTAKDIAKFWNYPDVVSILDKGQSATSAAPSLLSTIEPCDEKNFFAKEFLDRAASRRKDKEWLKDVIKQETTTFLLFKDLDPLVIPQTDHSTTEPKGGSRLFRARYSHVKQYLEPSDGEGNKKPVVFLGLERSGPQWSETKADKTASLGSAWFALSVPDIPEAELSQFHAHASWLQAFPGSLQLDPRDSGVFAQARSVLAWHDRYGFCSTCGKATIPEEGGYKRSCTDETCRSRKGVHNTCYPRVDPSVIMVVVCPEGRRILLGRGARFPRGMYSCLAGFVEPGETLEAACRREVLEEAGVEVGRVEYHSCQPWPLPASLMIGCLAHAASDHIKIDKDELEDARWFSRQDIINMLNNRHPERLYIPPEQAIAHVLIRTWVNMTSNL